MSRLVFLPILLLVCAVSASAQNMKQAREAIAHIAGFNLPTSGVRVKSVSANEAIADVRAVFRFEQDVNARWRVAEVRTAQDKWESVALLARAAGADLTTTNCTAPDAPFKGSSAVDPSVRRARCLIGALTGIDVPSDEVRIQEVDPFVLPLASQASATVVAWIRMSFRLVNEGNRWRVSELRTGNRGWLAVQPVMDALNAIKRTQALSEMKMIAEALERYRKDRGFYVVADSEAVLVDHLSPRYLAKIIRVDSWNRPYKYKGSKNDYLLYSVGPDGRDDTSDDIKFNELTQPR